MPVEATPNNIRLIAGTQDAEVTFQNRGRVLDLYRAGKVLIESSGVCEPEGCVPCRGMDEPMCERYQALAAEEAFLDYELSRQSSELPVTIPPISPRSAYFAK